MVDAIKVNGGIWYRLPGTGLDILVKTIGPHVISRHGRHANWDVSTMRDNVKYREHSDRNQGLYAAREPERL
jgi:hypothetical protein